MRSYVNELRQKYPAGTKVRLISMNDFQAPPTGTIGIVRNVDDIGTIHINWENGSSLGVVEDDGDRIEVIA